MTPELAYLIGSGVLVVIIVGMWAAYVRLVRQNRSIERRQYWVRRLWLDRRHDI